MINIQDVILLLNIILNNNNLDYQQIIASDINGDNQIDILDIIDLITIILS
jgi:hypothetical protein